MLKILLIALFLNGSTSNQHGRIGIVVSKHGTIYKVYKYSPASYVLEKGDIVLSADGCKGIKYVDGPVGSEASLIVKRKGEEFKLIVLRVPKESIHD